MSVKLTHCPCSGATFWATWKTPQQTKWKGENKRLTERHKTKTKQEIRKEQKKKKKTQTNKNKEHGNKRRASSLLPLHTKEITTIIDATKSRDTCMGPKAFRAWLQSALPLACFVVCYSALIKCGLWGHAGGKWGHWQRFKLKVKACKSNVWPRSRTNK